MVHQPTKAQLLIKKCKEDIIDHIRYEMGLIHTAVNADDEDGIHTDEMDWVSNPTIMIEVQDPYSMDYYEEPRVVVSLSTEENGDICVETEEGGEISISAVPIEGLQHIADCLEESYKHLVNNN